MKFKDHDLIPKYARGAIYNLVKLGLLFGSNGYLYYPNWIPSQREQYTRELCIHDRVINYLATDNVRCVEKAKPAIVGIRADNSIGTGTIITSNGNCLTNWHVIKDCYTKKGDVLVQTHDVDVKVLENRKGYHGEFEKTEVFKAKIIDVDRFLDLALLKIEAKDLPYLEIAKEALHEGEKVVAIGHPFNLGFVSHGGYISQDCQNFQGMDFMQTDAKINEGNSGGALVGVRDQKLVGVPVSKITMVGDTPAEGLGFCVMLKYVREFVERNNISI